MITSRRSAAAATGVSQVRLFEGRARKNGPAHRPRATELRQHVNRNQSKTTYDGINDVGWLGSARVKLLSFRLNTRKPCPRGNVLRLRPATAPQYQFSYRLSVPYSDTAMFISI